MANQYRNYCLTINNPKETDAEFNEYLKRLENVKYFIFQREKGEETGTEHFQVYIEFTFGKKFDVMKKLFPTAHIERREGRKSQARAYCCKEDTRIGEVFEYGTFAEEGERSDWVDILSMIAAGATNAEIRDAYPSQFLRYYKAIEDNREMLIAEKYATVRRMGLKVIYIYGNAGVGKTRYVLDTFGDDKVFRMTDYGASHNNERFDGYCGQEVLLFDEYRSQIEISRMLNYLDVYPLQLPARFHNKTACYKKVFIVSNIPLLAQYAYIQQDNPATWQGFYRRIDEVYNFNISKDKPIETPKADYERQQKTKAPISDQMRMPLSEKESMRLPF